jgi:glycosyltransferase involved in cell wall biosynthesis
MNPETVGRLTRLKRRLTAAGGGSPGQRAFVVARDGYRRHVRRWLSQEAIETLAATRSKALALVGRTPNVVPDPPLPSGMLTLGGGLVYLTIFNLGDKRKNYLDLLSAFLLAFRDRADVTLVIKLVTNRVSEHNEMAILRARYRALGLVHRCRVVVITEFLSEEQMSALFQVTTYYVNASHAEGACLPLMRSLAGGRPAIAPDHTAMADYMDEQVGFVPRSFLEPIDWPHDPEERIETFRYRPVWSDLRDAFLLSAEVAEHQLGRYQALALAARTRMADYAGHASTTSALREALKSIPAQPTGALGWAS